MKAAGLIYLLCGLLIVGAASLGTTFGNGFGLGTILLAIFGIGFLVLGRSLMTTKPGARSYAIVCSSLIVVGIGYDAISFVVDQIPALRKFGAPSEFWWIFAPLVAIALGHALALALLLQSRPAPRSK